MIPELNAPALEEFKNNLIQWLVRDQRKLLLESLSLTTDPTTYAMLSLAQQLLRITYNREKAQETLRAFSEEQQAAITKAYFDLTKDRMPYREFCNLRDIDFTINPTDTQLRVDALLLAASRLASQDRALAKIDRKRQALLSG